MILTGAIVMALAFVQSLFGVGLLVFGTPTLMLLGSGFQEALATLLPASFAISLLQAREGGLEPPAFLRQLALWCLPALSLMLALALSLDDKPSLEASMAAVLAFFLAVRLFPGWGARVSAWVQERPRLGLFLMGLVHGYSNLGGGLLLVFAAARSRDKEAVRRTVVTCYLVFSSVQMLVLALMAPDVIGWSMLLYAGLAGTVYATIGRVTFSTLPAAIFNHLLSLLIGLYALSLGLRAARF